MVFGKKTDLHPARELAAAPTKKTLLHEAGTNQNAGIHHGTVLLNLKKMCEFNTIDLYPKALPKRNSVSTCGGWEIPTLAHGKGRGTGLG